MAETKSMMPFIRTWRRTLTTYRSGLRSPRYVSWRRIGGVATIVVALVVAVHLSPLRDPIESPTARRLEFALRRALHLEPDLSPRIKVFVYDDAAVSGLQSMEVSLDDWTSVLEAIAAEKPRAIVIDKLFDKPEAPEALARFKERLARLASPVFTGAFVRDREIKGRTALGRGDSDGAPFFAYGPLPELAASLANLGHIVYAGYGKAVARYQLQDGSALDHLSIKVFPEARPSLDRHGRFAVDLLSQEAIMPKTIGMKGVILRARQKKPLGVIAPGDVVLVLPNLFTGSTDFIDGPAGRMPGPLFLAAALNDAARGVFLRPVDEYGVSIVFLGALGMLAGAMLWGKAFWVALVAGASLVAGGGLIAFCSFGWTLPWLPGLAAFYGSASSVYAIRAVVARIEEARMSAELGTAKLVQSSFFPKQAARAGVLQVAGTYVPASECCGDWWSHEVLADGRELVLIGDAMGHGAPAALLTAMAFATCRVATSVDPGTFSPAGLLRLLNDVVHGALETSFTMSFQVALIDTAAGSLVLANAGHLPPLLSRVGDDGKRAKPQQVTARGGLLGLGPMVEVEEVKLPLRAGDRLLFFTDGMIECGAASPGKGKHELAKRFGALADANEAKATADALMARKKLDLAGAPADDDLTVVIVAFGDTPAVAAAPIIAKESA